jgi:quercetin 2,3-dioxygenase
MSQYIFYPEASRGHTKTEWLDARHAFNFAGFNDPERNPFGALVILNEDTIQPGKGFGTHGHQNMEIISIILEGRVNHTDNMGNEGFIDEGEAQLISAGTGITHSEYNYYNNRRLKLLQVWIKPDHREISPQYSQMVVDNGMVGVTEIISPHGKHHSMRVHQQAWMYLVRLPQDEGIGYAGIRSGNGVYVYLLEGKLNILGKKLMPGDAIGVTGTSGFDINADSDVLAIIIDVPMD